MRVRWHKYLLTCSECDESFTADAATVKFNARGEVFFSGKCPGCREQLKAKTTFAEIMKLCGEKDKRRSLAK